MSIDKRAVAAAVLLAWAGASRRSRLPACPPFPSSNPPALSP